MKLKYKVGLILLPLIAIIAYQVHGYSDFSKDIDNLRETVVIPATEEALLSANIQFLSAQLSTSLQRAIIALQSGHEKGVKEAIQKNILTREQRQVELQKLREVSTEFLLQEDKLSTQLAKDMENLITKVDNLNERITSEIAASSGTAEQINIISRKVNSELAPFENKLFFTLTVVLENSVSKVAETRKIFTEVKKRGVQKLYLISILSLIVFISIVLFLNFWIVNPIKKLTKGAEIIGKGELEHKIDIKSKDEIGELSTTFNQMTENLKVVTASRDDLNKEIAERKKAEEALKDANQQLMASEQQLRAANQQLDASNQQLRANEQELRKHRERLEELVRERTTELQTIVNSMAGREVRMAELKETIQKLRDQLESAGLTPVADDPLRESSNQ